MNLNILGDKGRDSAYDPDLAHELNEEVAEEIRRKKLKEKAGKGKKEEAKEQQPKRGQEPIALDNLIIEETSPRTDGNPSKSKVLYTFNKSLEELDQKGFERHLRPQEAFRILIDAIENKASQYKALSNDMRSSYGEWLSLAMGRTSDSELVLYLDPKNLVWNSQKSPQYKIQGPALEHSQELKFKIPSDIKSGELIDLNRFPQDLVEALYSRPFNELPQVMQKGAERSQLWLPQKGIILPCSRSSFGSFDVDSDVSSRASRGVRSRAP
jgi:hypothetical protein